MRRAVTDTRMKSGRTINRDALRGALSRYLYPGSPWPNDERMFKRMVVSQSRLARKAGISAEAMPEFLFDNVMRRAETVRFSTHIYTTGGSGSHWIGQLLQDSCYAIYLGEAYFPAHFHPLLEPLDAATADAFIDAVELLHMARANPLIAPLERMVDAPTINSAHHLQHYCFFKNVRRNRNAIHLIRDPRDRTLSVAYRKDNYRQIRGPVKDDQDYLASIARQTRKHHESSGELDAPPPRICYEEILIEPERGLRTIASLLGLRFEEERLEEAFRRNNVDQAIDATLTAGAANPAKLRRNWRESGSARDLAFLHSELAETIVQADYLLCDCLGRKRIADCEYRPIEAQIEAGWLPYLTVCGFGGEPYWRPLDETLLSGQGRLRLRTSGDVPVHDFPPGFLSQVTDLCAARADVSEWLPLLPAMTSLEIADLQMAEPFHETIAALGPSVSQLLLLPKQSAAFGPGAAGNREIVATY